MSLGERDLVFSLSLMLGFELVLLPSLWFGRSSLSDDLGGWTRLESFGERDLALLPVPLGGAVSRGTACSGGVHPQVSCFLGAWPWLLLL